MLFFKISPPKKKKHGEVSLWSRFSPHLFQGLQRHTLFSSSQAHTQVTPGLGSSSGMASPVQSGSALTVNTWFGLHFLPKSRASLGLTPTGQLRAMCSVSQASTDPHRESPLVSSCQHCIHFISSVTSGLFQKTESLQGDELWQHRIHLN